MPSDVRPLRPRLVIRIARDGSLDFAATSDVEVIIVRAGWRRFRIFPTLRVGIEHVRRLLSDGESPKPAMTKRAQRIKAAH
jgi:hypothetical protein